MSRLHGWWTRLRRATDRSRFERDMADEMRQHLELEAAAYRARGLDDQTARRQAALAFGHTESFKEEVRERRLGSWLGQTWQDMRYGARILAKLPGFTFVAVATLAIGIAANTAIFSTLYAVLLRPLPYTAPDRLVQVFETIENGGLNSVSGGAFVDWRQHATRFDSFTLVGPVNYNLRSGNRPDRLSGLEVSHEFEEVFGIQPLLGRGFRSEDERFGGQTNVVILTEELWRTRFGGNASIIGHTIVLDEVPRTVIGILPRGAWIFRETQFLVPAVLAPDTQRSRRAGHWADVFGRLKPGVTVEQGDAELKTIKRQLAAQYPNFKQRWGVAVRPLHQLLAGDPRPVVLTLLGAVSLVLLIACANVANLLLARACHRQQEIALRAALGATSRRIVRQVLTESLLLAALGGAVGILLSRWGVDLLARMTADVLPSVMAPRLDGRVLAFAVAITALTGLLFGILPAWRARRPDVNDVLKNGGYSATAGHRHRTQSALVIAEVALTVMLLAAAGLLLRSLANTTQTDPGFEPDRLLAFDLTVPAATYESPERRLVFVRDLLTRIRALPGVETAGAGMAIPFTGGGFGEYVRRTDRPDDRTVGRVDYVSEGYLETLGTRLLGGRYLRETDNRSTGPRVMVINEATARLHFPGQDAVGQRLLINDQAFEVVGVIANVVDRRLDLTHRPFVYLPQALNPLIVSIVVRTPLEPARIVGSIREQVQQIDPGLPLVNVRTLEEAMASSMTQRRLVLTLIAAFAVAATALACIGLYGVMAYSVATRRRELCIRMALGAARSDVIQYVLNNGMRLIAIGVIIGLAGALGAARLMQGLLFQVRSYDPLVMAGTVVVIAAAATIACWMPAWRATRYTPLAALRNE